MPGWLQGSYTLASLNAACQRLVNLYPEVIEAASEKAVGYLKGCPGLATALLTLPPDGDGFSDIRGFAVAGTSLNPLSGTGGRLFAVAGKDLYEVFADGTYTDRSALPGGSTIGNDHRPVTLLPNGNQLGIISAGLFYIDNGAGPVLASAQMIAGTVTVALNSPVVLWATGDKFTNIQPGNVFFINAVMYTVQSIALDVWGNPDYTKLVLTSAVTSANGTYLYTVSALNGTLHSVGTTVTWISGDLFPLTGVAVVEIDGSTSVVVASVVNDKTMILAAPAGNGDHAFGINQTLTAASGTFLDTFFVVSPPNTNQINVSAPGDGTTWDPLDVAFKESYPDKIGKVLAEHEDLYVLGEVRSEVWRAPGADPNFPFQRDPGACMSLGIAAPDSACAAAKGIAWIAGDTRGQPYAVYAEGFAPQRISTHAVEQVWASYAQVSDAIGFVYELDGHLFWQISFPTGDATWVYDFTASAQMGKPMWHERNSWDGSAFHRHRAICHAYVWGKHYVGDFARQPAANAGNIYAMASDIYEDAGQTITCIRTLTHLCEQRLREFFTKLQLDLETGGGVALTIVLEWSDDGGTTFVGGGTAFTYTTSLTNTIDRAVFFQMGSADQGDRVFRITVSGNARKALINCYLDSLTGIS